MSRIGAKSSGNTRLPSAQANTGTAATATPIANRRAGSAATSASPTASTSAANPIATRLVASHARSGAGAHVIDSADHATSALIAPTASRAGPPHAHRRLPATAATVSAEAPTSPQASPVAPAPTGRRPRSTAPCVILSTAQPANARTDNHRTTLVS